MIFEFENDQEIFILKEVESPSILHLYILGMLIFRFSLRVSSQGFFRYLT